MASARLGCRALALLILGARQASAQIRIMSPVQLVNQLNALKPEKPQHGRIDGSTATFGAPFFGQRILGRLRYAPHTGETAETSPHCTEDYSLDFCGESQGALPQEDEEKPLINIFLVRRGGCSFVKKVKIAAKKCAHAVIIVDRHNSNSTSEDLQHIIVADDGYGGEIQIPSVLISRFQGELLLNTLTSDPDRSIVAELAWDIPTDRVVNVDMWISSASRESLRFLREFAPKRRELNTVISFTPHYAVFSMEKTDPAIYNDLCTDTSGQYCAEDPDGAGPVKGSDVLEEDVRQLCIHSIYKRKASSDARVQFSEEFWSYVEQLGEACPIPDGDSGGGDDDFGFKCSMKLMNKVGIDTVEVMKCASETKEAKLKDQREHPAWSPRALRINGWRYTGMLDPDLVTRAICSGFITEPPECKTLLTKRDPTEDLHTYDNEVKGGGVTFGEMFSWLGITLLVAFGALLLYKRYLKKEMRVTLREEVYIEVEREMAKYRQMQG